jgi:hypothetical protein
MFDWLFGILWPTRVRIVGRTLSLKRGQLSVLATVPVLNSVVSLVGLSLVASTGVCSITQASVVSLQGRVIEMAKSSPTIYIGQRPPQIGVSHPRIWMNQARLNKLIASKNANTLAWQRVLNLANTNTYIEYGGAFGLAYLATGDPAYAIKGQNALASYCTEANTIVSDSGYSYRINMAWVIRTLDWCFNGLSSTVIEQAATWLMNRCDWPWDDLNPGSASYGHNNVSGNYFWGFMYCWPAALVCEGISAGSSTISGSGTARAAFHMNYLMNKYQTMIVPFFNGHGAGGASIEGTNYEPTSNVMMIADALYTATGDKQMLDHPYMDQNRRWQMHHTSPDFSKKMNYGDQALYADGHHYYGSRPRGYNGMIDFADQNRRRQMRFWANSVSSQASVGSTNSTWISELLWYDDPLNVAPATDYRTTEPISYFVPGAEIYSYRSDWTTTATWIATYCGTFWDNHKYLAANDLLIWKKDYVAANANMNSQSGINRSTGNFNCLTLWNGTTRIGQPSNGYSPRAEDGILAYDGYTSEYSYTSGSAGGFYGTTTVSTIGTYLEKFIRKVFYIVPHDTVVVIDRIAPKTAFLSWERHLRWFSGQNATITMPDQQNFVLMGLDGVYKAFGKLVDYTGAYTLSEITTSNGLSGQPGVVNAHAAQIASTSGATVDRFITVFQITPIADASPPNILGSNVADITGTSHHGTTLGVYIVMAGDTETAVTSLTYQTFATKHIIADLVPARNYTVTQQPAGGGATEATYSFTASLGGVGRFDTTPTGLQKRYILS